MSIPDLVHSRQRLKIPNGILGLLLHLQERSGQHEDYEIRPGARSLLSGFVTAEACIVIFIVVDNFELK